LKENPLYSEAFVSKSQYTAMAMLEMLTGIETEYAFRHGDDRTSVTTNGKDKQQEWKGEDQSKFQAWILGPEHTKPTANWNPTIIFSREGGLRAVKPFANAESFKSVNLIGASGGFDDKKTYDELWSDKDRAMVWIARLKINLNDMAPLSAAPKRIGDEISKSKYFTLEESIPGAAS
jgi:hypothetical protein